MGAEAGTIAIMVGGDRGQYDCILPILNAISPNVFYAGSIGNGHVIKLVNNLMSTVQRLPSFEAITLAVKNGMDPAIATDILLASGGRNAYSPGAKQKQQVTPGDVVRSQREALA